MRRVVVDASALAAVVFAEEAGSGFAPALEGCQIYAPTVLRYEMQNIAWKKCRRDAGRSRATVEALDRCLDARRGIVWMDPNPSDVVLLAQVTGLSAYDASYLWLAGFLGADLVTADRALAEAHDAFARV